MTETKKGVVLSWTVEHIEQEATPTERWIILRGRTRDGADTPWTLRKVGTDLWEIEHDDDAEPGTYLFEELEPSIEEAGRHIYRDGRMPWLANVEHSMMPALRFIHEAVVALEGVQLVIGTEYGGKVGRWDIRGDLLVKAIEKRIDDGHVRFAVAQWLAQSDRVPESHGDCWNDISEYGNGLHYGPTLGWIAETLREMRAAVTVLDSRIAYDGG